MEKQRLQKIIADCGYCSRRKAEELIENGRVKVNGRPCKLGDKADPSRDLISIDGENIRIEKKKKYRYIMLNKPRGYVTTMSDELDRKCVTELIENVGDRVYPIGRLDKNSEGLLLFTNDGAFANDIMHPSKHISKTYRVTVRPDIDDEKLVRLSEGVVIDGKKTLPCTVLVLDKQPGRVVLQMTITEGRNRQIRKMCEAVGLEVARLKRTSIGPIRLGMLKPGTWRDLKPDELRAIRSAIAKSAK
ncbi:MAG: pseudouridine synthase [Oscillospiraceae bacterium]